MKKFQDKELEALLDEDQHQKLKEFTNSLNVREMAIFTGWMEMV